MIEENESQNVYAFTIEGKPIHISDAKSGLQGYYCMGCEREMQAVKTKIIGRQSYFRHDPKAVKVGGKCTYSDETFRHKMAKEILQRIKKIKVPSLYKFPPKGQEGKANLIENAKVIEGIQVGIEKRFYENLEGEIICGEEVIEGDQFNIIRPDVTFFNEENNPILFIEIVATHKLSNEKRVKLKRLGIDAVQIKIPRDKSEEIERIFHVTKSTKWVYSHVEANTVYIPTPETSSEGIPSIDELQRDLFEEDIRCRLSQIRSLIRTINRCLESKPYRETEEGIRSEIRRVEKNTEREKAELERLRESIRKRIEVRIEEEEGSIRKKSEEFESKSGELEARYLSKRSEIEENIGRSERRRAELERTRIQSKEGEQRIRENIERIKFQIGEVEREEGNLPTYAQSAEKELRTEFRVFEERVVKQERSRLEAERGRISIAVERTQNEIEALEEEENGLSTTDGKARAKLRARFEKLKREIIERDEDGIRKQTGDFPREYQDLARAGRQIEDIHEAEITNQRKRAARGCFKSGAWKSWPR